jgi:hypothetical protein
MNICIRDSDKRDGQAYYEKQQNATPIMSRDRYSVIGQNEYYHAEILTISKQRPYALEDI